MINRPVHVKASKDNFSDSEVGLTHPFRPSYFRLSDNGNVEIIGDEGMGIIFNASNRSVTIIADTIRFQSKEEQGLRWNKYSFNSKSTKYTEPTFIELDDKDITNLYQGVDDLFED
jgi:hypothetical protein